MIILTIDTDWAPEEATLAILEKIKSLPIKTTVFFSTPSPLAPWALLEAGCHPDLSRRQAQPSLEAQASLESALAPATLEHDAAVKEAEGAILADYRQVFPQAQAVRTHRFYWHSDLSRLLVSQGFSHDSSLIMPFHPGLKGFRVGRLTRWPVWSSDHLHLARGLPLDSLRMPNWADEGLKIFCFHVAYLYHNTSCLKDFNMITASQPSERNKTISRKAGVWDLFLNLSEEVYKRSTSGYWLSEIPQDEYILKQELS